MYGMPQGSVLGPVLFVLYTTVLSDITANRSVNHLLFMDDTRSRNPLLSVKWPASPQNTMYTDDINMWMIKNQLKLKDDKTEALLFPFSSSLKPFTISFPDLITLDSHNIPFSDPATTTQYLSWKNWARQCYTDNMRVQASFLWAYLRARCRQPYSCINYARTGRPSHLNENSLAPDITFFPLMMNNWYLMSSDVSWHIRDKLWPMPKQGSIILYVYGNQKAR